LPGSGDAVYHLIGGEIEMDAASAEIASFTMDPDNAGRLSILDDNLLDIGGSFTRAAGTSGLYDLYVNPGATLVVNDDLEYVFVNMPSTGSDGAGNLAFSSRFRRAGEQYTKTAIWYGPHGALQVIAFDGMQARANPTRHR